MSYRREADSIESDDLNAQALDGDFGYDSTLNSTGDSIGGMLRREADLHYDEAIQADNDEDDRLKRAHVASQQVFRGLAGRMDASGDEVVQGGPRESLSPLHRLSASLDSQDAGSADELIDGANAGRSRGYNMNNYAHLNVNQDIKDLFEVITTYKPQVSELEPRFRPFIPDYIPAVGEMDPFLKMPRPDKERDMLGLTVLDEPGEQSNPSVVEMELRSKSRSILGTDPIYIIGIEDAHRKPKDIQQWIDNIARLRADKPAASVLWSSPFPAVDSLMSEWPPEFEKLLDNVKLPGADIDLSLEEYAKVVCALLDIPVHSNLVQSLHKLFEVYQAFKENEHFKGAPPGTAPGTAASLRHSTMSSTRSPTTASGKSRS